MVSLDDIWRKIFSGHLSEWRERYFPGRGGKTKCAKALGVSIQEWSMWEGGKRSPSIENINKIARLFEVEPIDLIYLHPNDKFGAVVRDPPTIVTAPTSLPVIGAAAADNAAYSRAEIFPPDEIERIDLIKEHYGLVKIIGNSMEPVLLDGQYALIGSEIQPGAPIKAKGWIGIIQVDCAHMEDQSICSGIATFCKRVYPVGKGDLLLSSINSAECAPFTVSRKHVLHLWPVHGVFFAGHGINPE